MRVYLAMVLAAMVLVSGCNKPTTPAAKPTKKVTQITICMYPQYIDPAILENFEKQTGITVNRDEYETNEQLFAKLQRSAVKSYDVIVVSDVAVPALMKLGLVRPLDYSKIPNVVNVADDFRTGPYDPEGRFCLPYQWGTVGLLYDQQKVPHVDISWSMLFNPERQPGPFVLMDSMRDLLGIALLYQGQSVNTRDLKELMGAADLLLATKNNPNKRCLGFAAGMAGVNKVASGEAVAAVVYNGDAVQEMAVRPNLAYAVPLEGSVLWVDVMMIPSRPLNLNGAHTFINYLLDSKVGAQLSNFTRQATPNTQAMQFIRPEDLMNIAIYPPAQAKLKLQYLHDLDKDGHKYDDVWKAVKTR